MFPGCLSPGGVLLFIKSLHDLGDETGASCGAEPFRQRFRQLYAGLPGYEALQEGIAVVSEHLVGGLGGNHLRLLAARVVAVRLMIEGVGFVECFQRLVNQYRFPPREAFSTTMRVFRGGGLTKVAAYLRGLVQTLRYFADGGGLEPLLIGKIAVEHIPMIRELRWRQVLSEPTLRL